MVPTSAQIAAALSYTSVFNLYSASLTPPNQVDFADATNWISIGIDTGVGDTIEYLYQAIDPAGIHL